MSDDELLHYGTPRHSGRYPWGSGNDAYQNSVGLKKYVDDMRNGPEKLTITQIAKGLGVSSTELRNQISIATETIRGENIQRARTLAAKNMSNRAIAEQMLGDPTKESTIRGWLQPDADKKANSIRSIAESLKKESEQKPLLDVGAGTELYMSISKTKLAAALALLQDEGYTVHEAYTRQLGTGENTRLKVLTKDTMPKKEVYDNLVNLQNVASYLDTNSGNMMTPKKEPVSIDLNRIDVRYANQGGTKMDGVIELRRGVADLDLGENKYAQVRIAVNGTHYLKGMAIYADDLPPGKDIRFNTNKDQSMAPLDTMKKLKTPEESPNRFGASISRTPVYLDKNGKEKTSALNMVNEEGKWDDWSKSLSSQMLSKQPVAVASAQLAKTRQKSVDSLKEINSLTNPVVKKRLLQEYADNADAAAVHLKAAAIDRQATKVLLPMNSMRPNEIFAPDFENGQKVVLVRYPHGGTFEIPSLTVNNKNLTAKRIMGGARDAVGIHHSVAEKLSGADFDGDTVLVIPNDSGKIKSRDPLQGLVGFDPKERYAEVPGMVRMTKPGTQKHMGNVSNLITDMTIKGATDEEMARAVRHSMVVIDAEKHKLNYKQSEIDNNIAQLKAKYQGSARSGASTIVSRASSDARIPEVRPARKAEGGPIDLKTGEKRFVQTGRVKYEQVKDPATGQWVLTGKSEPFTTKGTKAEFVTDAHKLTSKYDSKGNPSGNEATPMERVYADHSNAMKSLANEARLSMVHTKVEPGTSKAAQQMYAKEVESLKAKLQVAQRNAPLERQAQVIGNKWAQARLDANPQLEKDDVKRVKFQSLEEARRLTGAGKERIGTDKNPLTDREWEAIQARAISPTMLSDILNNADMTRVKSLATPRPKTYLSPGQQARITSLRSMGRSTQEIADALGIPRSTVSDHLK